MLWLFFFHGMTKFESHIRDHILLSLSFLIDLLLRLRRDLRSRKCNLLSCFFWFDWRLLFGLTHFLAVFNLDISPFELQILRTDVVLFHIGHQVTVQHRLEAVSSLFEVKARLEQHVL